MARGLRRRQAFSEYLHSRHRRRNGRRARRDRSERRRPQEPAGGVGRDRRTADSRGREPRRNPSASGTAVIEWPVATTVASPRFDVFATTGVVASGRTIPLMQGSVRLPLAGEGHHSRHQCRGHDSDRQPRPRNAGKPRRSAVVSSCERWIRPQSSAGCTSASPARSIHRLRPARSMSMPRSRARWELREPLAGSRASR